jgi:Ser/Thr protein kinase RdoA (MazF antagonist)
MNTAERQHEGEEYTGIDEDQVHAEGKGDPLPVVYSILSAEALLHRIAEAYSIGATVSCQLLRPGSNDTYLVTTRDDRFIARVYGEQWRSLSEIHYEIDLLRHLAARGTSVSLPIAADDGLLARPLRAPEGTRYLVLFTCAAGKALDWTEQQHCYQAGRVAAALHTASDDFESPHARFQLDLEYLVDEPLAALQPFLAHRPADWSYVEAFAARVRGRASDAIEGGLDWGVCHGDLGNRNIHVDDGGSLTVIDFDLAAPGPRAYDFVAAQWLASYEKNTPLFEVFLRGYTEERPLAERDLAAVPIFHGISRLWTIGLDARNARRWGTLPMSDFYLDTYLRSLREWEDERDWQ